MIYILGYLGTGAVACPARPAVDSLGGASGKNGHGSNGKKDKMGQFTRDLAGKRTKNYGTWTIYSYLLLFIVDLAIKHCDFQ
jgi:hypothetical protein